MRMSGDEVGEIERMKYLGFVLHKDEDFKEDMKYSLRWIFGVMRRH